MTKSYLAMNWHIKLQALLNISFEVFVLMNSINPIKFGMFAMINDTLNVMFKSQCTQSKFFFDDTSLKLDACQLERHRNKTFETFFIGHVRYESRALHKKLSILIGMLILTFLFAYQI